VASKKILTVIFSAMIIVSCVTAKLWEATDPNTYVAINMKDISERELIDKKVKYFKNYENGFYYVEKGALQKFQDYSLRVLGTPVTVVIDTATVILVVGLLHVRVHNIYIK
jgi:hypothetical protein